MEESDPEEYYVIKPNLLTCPNSWEGSEPVPENATYEERNDSIRDVLPFATIMYETSLKMYLHGEELWLEFITEFTPH